MCCMAELENVLIQEYDAELVLLPNVPRNLGGGATVICVLLALYELRAVEAQLARLRNAGNRVILYFFDCWYASYVLYRPRQKLRNLLGLSKRLEDIADRICLPFREICDSLEPQHQAMTSHVPLAVDSQLVNGYNADRPISVLAYGQQLPTITNALARGMNRPGSGEIFHHTDHFTISRINDPGIHRMHFWKMAESSQIALAFDPKLTSPHRVPISIVGQRWYESLAAGCVVVGVRPTTKEADELLDWPDSTIELPADPAHAIEFLRMLCADKSRLASIRERNVAEVRKRHDWRNRIPTMLA